MINKKKLSVICLIVALLCISMFAGFVSANPTYAAYVYAYGSINGGYIGSPTNILGTVPDNVWTQIYGSSAGKGGYILVQMNSSVAANSYIAIYAKAASGYTSSFLGVYVSNDGTSFTGAGSNYITTTIGTWYFFQAPSNGTWQYIMLYGVGPYPENIFIDSVLTI
jgi:hypothetical protein